jgi:hypothetical protein
MAEGKTARARRLLGDVHKVQVRTVGDPRRIRDGVAVRPSPAMPQGKCKKCSEKIEFIDGAISKLLEQGSIEECERWELTCVLAMSVKINAHGAARLCIDGRPVNRYEVKKRFKFESLAKEGRDVFTGCTHGGIGDITSAYHPFEIRKDMRTYLGIWWKGKWYRFCVLPFGLQSAPWIFCTIVGECVGELRKGGIKMVSYVDDFPHGTNSAELEVRNCNTIINFLRRCGFIIDEKAKCLGYEVALERFTALGFIIDLKKQMCFCKPERKTRVLGLAAELWEARSGRVKPRRVSCWLGASCQ